MIKEAWLTRADAALLADVSERTIDRWLRSGALTKHKRPGWRTVLIDPNELAARMDAAPVPVPQRSAP